MEIPHLLPQVLSHNSTCAPHSYEAGDAFLHFFHPNNMSSDLYFQTDLLKFLNIIKQKDKHSVANYVASIL